MSFEYHGFSQERKIYGLLVAKSNVKMDADIFVPRHKNQPGSWGPQPVQSRVF